MICVPLGCSGECGGAGTVFSAMTSAVGVALFSQLLSVRNEDLQGTVRGLRGYAVGTFLARDVFVGSGFTSVDVVELTCYCCCRPVVPRRRLSVVLLFARVGFYP